MKKAIKCLIILLFLTSASTMVLPTAETYACYNSNPTQTTRSSSLASDSITIMNDQSGLSQPYVIDQEVLPLIRNPPGQDPDSLFSGESSQVQNTSLHVASTPLVESPGGFAPLVTPPPVVYDLQLGLTFSQNYSALSYNVTAVKQVDEFGYGPGYLLNGLTDTGYWYQVGVVFNWPYQIGGYGPGWHFIYWVFSNDGSPIYGNAIDFNGPVNDGDIILLRLTYSSGNVVMFAQDWNTSSTAQQTYSAMGGSYFRGLTGAIGDANGFFTGLMTEWYHVNPYYGNQEKVIYSNSASALSAGVMWADEWVPKNGSVLFGEGWIYSFSNPMQLLYYPPHGCACVLAANGNIFVTGAVWATKTWTVDDNGPANFSTIQKAVDAAAPRDTILVFPGTYNETVSVYKSITLLGKEKNQAIIDGNFTRECIDVIASGVTINGFTIQRSGKTSGVFYGVGVYPFNAGPLVVASSGTNVSGNIIALNFDGIFLYESTNNAIYGNNITNNYGRGIITQYSSNNCLSLNNITNNILGFYLIASSNNTLSLNNITNNTNYGIYLSSSSTNKIFHNHFVGNTVQARVDSSIYPNIWDYGYPSGGNYWSTYNGPDVNHDGIGDTPYVIGANNTDRYPLMAPSTCAFEGATGWYWTNTTVVNSVATGDVDGDGQVEVVTGGYFNNGLRNIAQLIVWNSSSLAPKRLTTWYWIGNTTVNSIALADINGDGQTEIVTGGSYFDGTRQIAQLVIWSGSSLAAEKIQTWYWTGNTVINSVALGDVDGEGKSEVVTGGFYNDGVRDVAQLCVWNSSNLGLENVKTWFWTGNTVVNSVALGDVDADGQVEIVTGGSYFDVTRNVAQLIEWNGLNLAVDRLTGWYWINNTTINSVAIGDVDNDGNTEIVTGGYYNDGVRNVAQLVVWVGSSLAVDRLTGWYWTGDTVINSIASGDVDGDGQVEVVTGGFYFDGIRNNAQLVVWSGSNLAVENIRTWYLIGNTAINSIAAGDVNRDFSAEIITGGSYYDGMRLNAQLTVWGRT